MQTKTPKFHEAHRGSKRRKSVIRPARKYRGILVFLTLVSLAISADLVGFQLQETLDGSLVLRCPLSGGVRCAPGHDCGTVLCKDKVKMRWRKSVLAGGEEERIFEVDGYLES